MVVEFVKTFADAVCKQLSAVVEGDARFSLRWHILDLVLVIIVGAVKDNHFTHPNGLDSINHYECKEWLKMHGASEEALRGTFVRGLYNLPLSRDYMYSPREL